ncbi:MAG TPA: NADP-dependent oxidoreductase [Burkholderiaceae bacterium]|nr:NADP-dependent oxidoreductase [Burkholderiaceae bacterium]
MTSSSNRQVRLASRPVGRPGRDDWRIVDAPMPEPMPGGVLVQTLMLSLDPAMRGWMNEGKSYIEPVGIDEVMRAGGVGRVVASSHPGFAVGDHVSGVLGVQRYCGLDEAGVRRAGLVKIDPSLAPLPKWLNALGMPGMTAYFGLLEVGQPRAGETVVVSGAAGAVGQTVGQVAKIKGCRVVGIAGGQAKCDFVVRELGFDACIDYKAGSVRDGLKQHCPKGVDVYFDNVGGEILDTVLTRINRKARIVICGAISQYNNTGPVVGPSNYLSLLVNRARMEGMVVFDYANRYGEAIRDIAGWMREGRFTSREDVVEGLDTFPEALLRLFDGENFGKLVLRVAD